MKSTKSDSVGVIVISVIIVLLSPFSIVSLLIVLTQCDHANK